MNKKRIFLKISDRVERVCMVSMLVFSIFIVLNVPASGRELNYLGSLFDIREEISGQSLELPEFLREAVGADVRTLERIFELNTSALTTIEAYFRIFRIALSGGGEVTEPELEILNEWLEFIRKQCSLDLAYLRSALEDEISPSSREQVELAVENIRGLSRIAQMGIEENKVFLE